MAASNELRHLLRALDERDIALSRDDVAWAFEGSTRDEIETWTQEYLSSASLLTHEELTFHRKQPRHSRDQNTASSGRPLSDLDVEAAITSLEASTAAIDKQCQLMEVQRDALQDLKARRSHDHSTDQMHAQRQKNLAREKAQVEFNVHELADQLRSGLKTASRQTDAALKTLYPSVDKVFEKDDRMLDGLQAIVPKLADAQLSRKAQAEVEALCQALIALTAQEVRSRLDYAYQSALGQRTSGEHNLDASAETQKASLQTELEELSSEIDSLAAMSVDAQYRLPIIQDLQNADSDNDLERARWSGYMLSALQFLTIRLEALDDHHNLLSTHRGALSNVGSALEDILATSASSKQHPVPQSPATPVARGLKPLRLVQANYSEDPTSQLLRHFEIRTSDPTDTVKLAATLSRAVTERQLRLAELGSTTERTISEQLAETMRKADNNVRELLGAVYAHSPYGSVRLVDADVQTGIEELEDETESLGEEMRRLNVEHLGRKMKGYM